MICTFVNTVLSDSNINLPVQTLYHKELFKTLHTQSVRWNEQPPKMTSVDDHVLDMPALSHIGGTALIGAGEIKMQANNLPSTFVPGRNLLFLTYGAALAYRRGLDVLVGGMCETDYSGYPDCRRATLDALETALALGMDTQVSIETPLMHVDKAATWKLADELGGDALVELIVEHTHTCYRGNRSLRHDWGYGCGDCPACDLRQRGFAEWKAA